MTAGWQRCGRLTSQTLPAMMRSRTTMHVACTAWHSACSAMCPAVLQTHNRWCHGLSCLCAACHSKGSTVWDTARSESANVVARKYPATSAPVLCRAQLHLSGCSRYRQVNTVCARLLPWCQVASAANSRSATASASAARRRLAGTKSGSTLRAACMPPSQAGQHRYGALDWVSDM